MYDYLAFHSLFIYLGAIALTNSPFTEAAAPLLLGDISCNGSEPTLLSCPHNTDPLFTCGSQFEDAGVICQGMHMRSTGV